MLSDAWLYTYTKYIPEYLMRNKSVGSKSTTLNNCVFEDGSSPSMNTTDTLRGKH